MILGSYLTYVWVFFAILAGLYALLLFSDYQSIIPDSFKKNKNHSFYDIWRNFTGSFWLFVCAGFVLLTFADNNYDENNISTYIIYLSFGLLSILIGFTAMFFVNRKVLHLFDPDFYVRNNLVRKTKEEKAQERAQKKASKARIKAYKKDMEERRKAFMEKEGK